jgi:mannan endo-1,4-beta-mannosidase
MTILIYFEKLMKTRILRLVIFLLPLVSACVPEYTKINLQKELGVKLVDTSASDETVYLFSNLKRLSESNKIIFGQHEPTAYGIGWRGDANRSDISDVIKDFPGLYGWDFYLLRPRMNLDSLYDPTKKLAQEAYARGGVNTFCWHVFNFLTDNDFYDVTPAVAKILPGGDCYLKYLATLDKVAEYAKSIVDSTGKPIPIIFRPYHEFEGNWFWWGKNFCTPEEFKTLWRMTVTYLRDKKGVRNFIYAFSPDRNFKSKEEYLDRYPGDEYVDVYGMDDYYDYHWDGDGLEWVRKKLKIMSDLAIERNKIAAFTETGLEGVPNHVWWTSNLEKALEGDSIKIAYVMVWRNANTNHHYGPYKGSASADDFVMFSHKPKILLNGTLPNLYTKKVTNETIKMIEKKKTIQNIRMLHAPLMPF